ncbi:MAG TPA: hypothetical protein VGA75_11660 [Paracoccaceae bacterium]
MAATSTVKVAADLRRMVTQAEDIVEQRVDGPAAEKLAALLDEMQALVRILPAEGDAVSEGRAEVLARSEEDAIEAGFDNMPV